MTFSLPDAIAGAIAGAVSKTALAPIERVKLLMQLSGSFSSVIESNGKKTDHGKYYRYVAMENLGSWDVAKMIYREEGLLSFWRGNTSGVIRQGGSAALNFMLMDWYKGVISSILNTFNYVLNYNHQSTEFFVCSDVLAPFLSGGLAGCTTTTLMYPFDFVRTRLAMDIGSSSLVNTTRREFPGGMRDVIGSLWKSGTEGISGIYNGYGMALICVFLYRSLLLGGYDVFKNILTERRMKNKITHSETNELGFGERVVLAQFVSIFAGVFCYPFDSIRRRMMMQAGRPHNEQIYENSLQAIRKIWVKEGICGFFLGIGPNLLRSLGGTILLVTYDYLQVIFYDRTYTENS